MASTSNFQYSDAFRVFADDVEEEKKENHSEEQEDKDDANQQTEDGDKVKDQGRDEQKEENKEREANEETENQETSISENEEERQKTLELVTNGDKADEVSSEEKDKKYSDDIFCNGSSQENCDTDTNNRNCEDESETSNAEECTSDSSKANNSPLEKPDIYVFSHNGANLNFLKNEKNVTLDDNNISNNEVNNNSENAISSMEAENLNKSNIEMPGANENQSTITNNSKTNSSVPISEKSINFGCQPNDLEIVQGTEGTMMCTIENNNPDATEVSVECSGLDGTGIECFIDGEDTQKAIFLIEDDSRKKFPIHIVSSSSPLVSIGTYPFVISGDCTKNPNSGSCS
jgi:hypothetical protein